MSLFDSTPPDSPGSQRPLAERMRPHSLEDFIGQDHILGAGKPLRRQIERDELTSIILWGPPGVGKTTLAHLIAHVTRCEFIPFSAVLSGIKEIKAVMADAERLRRVGRRTILFVDEIHRFNKAQQDAFLPYVERGDIILIGATTENPSFEIIAALLSRSRVYALRALTVPEIVTLLQRALPVVNLRATGELLEQIGIEAGEIVFTPHLLPIPRGILATIYVKFKEPQTRASVADVYRKFFANSPMVRLHETGLPQIQHSVRTSYSDIGFQLDASGRRAVIVSCLDNLLKGASSQAVQNLNVMQGWPESEGLE